jgi:cation transport regulator ChaC
VSGLWVFGYGSLAHPASAALTLGREVRFDGIARLPGWRRRWTVYRDNAASEKTFAFADGRRPQHVLGLNLERDEACAGANGVLIEITEAEADRLDLREMRYDRIDVTAEVAVPSSGPAPARVIAYTAKPEHHAPVPPPDAVVIAEYVRTVHAAFTELGREHIACFHATTDEPPGEPAELTLVADSIPAGNPRRW